MADAVVGLLKAILTADTAQFEGGMKKAATSASTFTSAVKATGEETTRAGAAIDRIAQGLGGSRLVQTANNLTAAVEKLGGVTRLTEGEKARLNVTLDKAIQKYAALGLQAPKAMEELHNATKKPVQSMSLLDSVVGKFGATVAATFTIGAVIGAIKSAGQWAGRIDDLSKKMGISVEAVQRLDFAAKQNGTSIDAIATANARLSKSLVEGDKSTVSALNKLGFELDHVQSMQPDKRFATLASAIAAVPDPTERSALAMQLFGRAGADLLPVMGNLERDMSRAVVANKSMIEAGDRLGDSWDKLVGVGTAVLAGLIVPFEPALTRAANAAAVFAQKMFDVGDAIKRVRDEEEKRRTTPGIRPDPGLLGNRMTIVGALMKIRDQMDEVEFQRLVDSVGAPTVEGPDGKRRPARTNLPAAPGGLELFAGQSQSFVERKLEVGIARVAKTSDDASKKIKDLLKDIREFGEQQYRSLMAVAAAGALIPGQLSRALDLENKLGVLSPGFAFGPTSKLPQVVPGGALPSALMQENMLGPMRPPTFDFSKFMSANLGGTIMSAVTGGGGIGRSLGGLFGGGLTSKIFGEGAQKALSGALGKTIGGAIGSIVPGLGTVLGAVGGQLVSKLFGGLFGGGEKKKVQEALGKMLQEAGGKAAFTDLARSAGVGEDLMSRLFNAKKLKDYESALRQITAQMEVHNQKLKDQQTLTDAQAQRQQMLNEAIARQKFAIEELGPAMQRQQLAEQAEQILQDWKLLTGAGIDINAVIREMSDEVNAFILNARRTGIEVPEAMRPIIEQMIAQGRLLDENGRAFENLEETGLTFGATLTEMFKGVLEKLDQLIDKLNEAAKPRTGRIEIEETTRRRVVDEGDGGSGGPGRGDDTTRHHTGGLVVPRAHNGWSVPKLRSDEVPAILLSGERVLNREEARGYNANNSGWMEQFLSLRAAENSDLERRMLRAFRTALTYARP